MRECEHYENKFLSRTAQHRDLLSIMAIIRQAQASIKKLDIDQWQNGYPNESVFLSDIEKKQCYLFYKNTDAAGVMVISFEPEECYGAITGKGWSCKGDKYAVIHRMAVSSHYRGSTLSEEMLSFAENLCRENSILYLRTDTHRGNFPMQRLLVKNGYVYCGNVELDVQSGDPFRMGYEKKL